MADLPSAQDNLTVDDLLADRGALLKGALGIMGSLPDNNAKAAERLRRAIVEASRHVGAQRGAGRGS